MSIDRKLLDILACPDCKGPLQYDREGSRLLCQRCRLGFAVSDSGIPNMIIDEAKPLAPEEAG